MQKSKQEVTRAETAVLTSCLLFILIYGGVIIYLKKSYVNGLFSGSGPRTTIIP